MEEDISTVNKKHSFTAHNTYTENMLSVLFDTSHSVN